MWGRHWGKLAFNCEGLPRFGRPLNPFRLGGTKLRTRCSCLMVTTVFMADGWNLFTKTEFGSVKDVYIAGDLKYLVLKDFWSIKDFGGSKAKWIKMVNPDIKVLRTRHPGKRSFPWDEEKHLQCQRVNTTSPLHTAPSPTNEKLQRGYTKRAASLITMPQCPQKSKRFLSTPNYD